MNCAMRLSPHKWTCVSMLCCATCSCCVQIVVCEWSTPLGKRGNPAQTFHGTDSQRVSTTSKTHTHTHTQTHMLPLMMNSCIMYNERQNIKRGFQRAATQGFWQLITYRYISQEEHMCTQSGKLLQWACIPKPEPSMQNSGQGLKWGFP